MEAAAAAPVAAGTVGSRATLLQHWLSLALCGVFFMLHLLHTQRSLHYSELSTTCKAHTHVCNYIFWILPSSPFSGEGLCCHHFGFNNTKISGEALTLATANYSNTRRGEGGGRTRRTLQVDLPVYDNYALGTHSPPHSLYPLPWLTFWLLNPQLSSVDEQIFRVTRIFI